MRVTVYKGYPQLDDEALNLLRIRLAFHGNNRSALARELRYARSSISSAMDCKYEGDTKHLRAKIIETLADQVACPHLDVEIAPQACKVWRERPISAATGSRSDVKHWQACQSCIHNPARRAALRAFPVRGDESTEPEGGVS